ncbi:MAG: FAD-binding protein [Bacteroidetes bacterium]|nr:FAD-binding protein [Bacteroidota bacterium]
MPVSVQFSLNPEAAILESVLEEEARKRAGLPLGSVMLRKKSLDARQKKRISYLIQADVYSADETPFIQEGFRSNNVLNAPEVHIVGFGPAGMFAALQLIENGYKPVVLERGKAVRERRRDLADICRNGPVNPESNYCFGEGGAGTYSDGKLYTRSSKRGNVAKVLQAFIDHGASQNIAYDAHPHIGTNKLPDIVSSIRTHIESCGGEVHFNSRVDGLETDSGSVRAIMMNGGVRLPVNRVLLCTGHSARDIFRMLHNSGVYIEAKPFALGVRIEHPQALIDRIQYHCDARGPNLPPSSYSLVEQAAGRGVFSFCMCPGGIIAPAATAPGEIVVNGWSPSKRNNPFANSGFVASVDEPDFRPFEAHGPLRAMEFQACWEQKAYSASGSLSAPAQRLEDFIQGKHSATLPDCSYLPGIISSDLREALPAQVSHAIREALILIGTKMPAYRSNEAVMVGVESRTSSPVRIPRDKESLQHPRLQNLFPCGEGAGYAGGIVSAALDGMRVAQMSIINL